MNVIMEKQQENDQCVHYIFYVSVWELEYDQNKKKEDYVSKSKYGICIFNKITGNFSIDENQTDSYFTNRRYEKIMMYGKLKKYNEECHFPDIIHIATG